MKRFKLILSVILIVFTFVTVFQNLTFTVTRYAINDKNLPKAFNNLRIVQISDLHNNFYDKDNETLIAAIKKQNPDIIAITGDYIDKSTLDIDELMDFTRRLSKIAECYYITGNHEALYCKEHDYESMLQELENAGAKTVENTSVTIRRGGESINIVGLTDPLFREIRGEKYIKNSEVIKMSYSKIKVSGYTVLLAHRPNEFDTYVKFNPNIILSGHEHGGQFRFPFIGGLFAPGEGFLPKYDNGIFKHGDTTMIVSRGLGDGEAPIRLFNQPELVVIDIER